MHENVANLFLNHFEEFWYQYQMLLSMNMNITLRTERVECLKTDMILETTFLNHSNNTGKNYLKQNEK